jgi:hypothetical protein
MVDARRSTAVVVGPQLCAWMKLRPCEPERLMAAGIVTFCVDGANATAIQGEVNVFDDDGVTAKQRFAR